MIVLNKRTRKLEASGPDGYHGLPFDTGCGGLIICAIIVAIILLGIKYNVI